MTVNDSMPEWCASRAARILNDAGKAANGAKVLVLGVAYKQDIDDYRESPAIRVIGEFEKNGALVDFYDPYIPKYQENGKWRQGLKAISPEVIALYDLICITAAHTNLDYEMICSCGVPVFDCKNVTKNITDRHDIEVL